VTYPENFENKIGFNIVRDNIVKLCSSQPGKLAALADLNFATDFDVVAHRLQSTAEMRAIMLSDDQLAIGHLSDTETMLARAKVIGTALSCDELLSLQRSLTTINVIEGYFRSRRDDEGATPYPLLNALALELTTFRDVETAIGRTIDRFGEVKDSASAELADIRRQLSSAQASLNSTMRRVMARAIDNGYIEPDATPAVRDGRLVLPVSPMNKRKINGIVHDESASGKTFYIEPAEMVEANNRIRQLQIEEKREINRILLQLTDMIRPDIDAIIASIAQAAIFDFIRAKALYAIEIGGCMPNLSKERELEWYHAIHPVLLESLRRHGKEIVPLDITLSADNRILVISGPNAGGKSVCLKTVGIIQYMSQAGVLPPVYENSHIGIFDNIFIDIGDDQSIEDDLSTYSSHLRNMKFFLQNSDASTLLLIDEFGGGTEPQIGGAIAQAILHNFNDNRAWGVITTHFQNLKNFAEDTPGLINGSMLYDRHLMQPTFRLSIGNPGSSFAIEIARKTGLPATVIAEAEDIAGSDYVNLDKYLLDIARDKRYWENKRQQIRQKEKKIQEVLAQYEHDADTLRQARREIISDAKEQAKQILDSSNATVERTIREIRSVQAEKERTRAAREKLRQEKTSLEGNGHDAEHPLLKKAPKHKKQAPAKPIQPKQLAVGDNVRLNGQTTVGTIMEISGNRATVSFGMFKTTASIDRLEPTMAKPSSGAKKDSFVSSATTDSIRDKQLNFKQEIDVRGMRVDEALQAVTYFIDDAIQFNAGRVRILHGTGTGALRQSIRQYLNSIPSVTSARDEDVRFGGAGITVVELS
jgi:DNA mismatch repair protein MutS2